MNSEEWLANVVDFEADKFALKFSERATRENIWKDFRGYYHEGSLVGGYIQTYEDDKLANFKLLHVFSKYRSLKIGSKLVLEAIDLARKLNYTYWKCSSELDAWKFYEKINFKKQGQTTNYDSYLIIGKIPLNGYELDYTRDDYINHLIQTKYTLKEE